MDISVQKEHSASAGSSGTVSHDGRPTSAGIASAGVRAHRASAVTGMALVH
ncbi:hypothetical protein [Pseudarthrobacter sp. NS4]|uniref:hypothetical protein n=1 Tax=Pseudarthrobacter sp. NS4 TaxID=2973976 RepID=UPI002163321B|nr:hypothetical protein [Pseudarthrobacter sp. NS4]